MPTKTEVTSKSGPNRFTQVVTIGPHTLRADEPKEVGGDDLGPAPHDLLLAALGSCTSMTIKMYAERKAIPLTSVDVTLSQEKKQGAEHVIHRMVRLEGALTDEQRARLLEIANKCPVHKTLTGTIRIESDLAPPPYGA